jgi:sugar phosphate isomerase/epimerase
MSEFSLSISKTSEMKKIRLIAFLCIMICILLISCSRKEGDQKIVFTRYPSLKLGFTTQNFIQCVPVTLENVRRFIDYAVEKGFAWIELRDPDAKLTLEECRQLAQYAETQGVEIGYANQRGLLDVDFWQVYTKGLQNATAFKSGTRTIRALASGAEFEENENKKGFTIAEFEILVKNAEKAAQLAAENGLQLVIENGNEPLRGGSESLFGLADLLDATGPEVGWQFDTANFFSGARIYTKPADAKAFLETHIQRLHYIHLKSSQNQAAMPALTDNELDFDVIFPLLEKHDKPYVAIELYAIDDVDEIYTNMEESVKYLGEKGFVSRSRG